jgi:hypothetical protein
LRWEGSATDQLGAWVSTDFMDAGRFSASLALIFERAYRAALAETARGIAGFQDI